MAGDDDDDDDDDDELGVRAGSATESGRDSRSKAGSIGAAPEVESVRDGTMASRRSRSPAGSRGGHTDVDDEHRARSPTTWFGNPGDKSRRQEDRHRRQSGTSQTSSKSRRDSGSSAGSRPDPRLPTLDEAMKSFPYRSVAGHITRAPSNG